MILLGACHTTPPTVEMPTPLAPTTVTAVAATIEDPLPPLVATIDAGADAGWVRAIAKSKDFHAYEIGDGHVLLRWRVGPSHLVKKVDGADYASYPVNHVSRVDLVVSARGRSTTVPLGELPGWIRPTDLSYCKHRGFVLGKHDSWDFPSEPNVAAAFAIGIAQGGDDFLLVRDGASLHLLHRETDDGRCDDGKQGPLDICEGFEWARLAELDVGHATTLFELVTQEGKQDKPFDCTDDKHGTQLSPP